METPSNLKEIRVLLKEKINADEPKIISNYGEIKGWPRYTSYHANVFLSKPSF